MNDNKDKYNKAVSSTVQKIKQNLNTAQPIYCVDLSVYMPLLQDMQVSDEDKIDLLHRLYAICMNFIDMGLGVEMHVPSCGQVESECAETGAELRSHIYSTHQELIQNINIAAATNHNAAGEGVDV